MKHSLACLTMIWSLSAVAQSPPDIELVAYLPDLGAEISGDEVRRSIQFYVDFLADRNVAKANLTVVESVQALQDFAEKRDPTVPAIGVIHPLVATVSGEAWKLRPLAVPVQSDSAVAPRVVVALRGSEIEKLEDLKWRSLVITRPWEELTELLGLMLFDEPVRADAVLGQLMLAETSAQAVAAVLQRKADAALVNSYVHEVSARQNRRVWSNLKVVGKTPPTHLAVVVAFDGTPETISEEILQAILEAGDSKAGRQLLDAFEIDRFERITFGELEAVEGKLIARLGPRRGGETQFRLEQLGDDLGLTFELPSRLNEEEEAYLRYHPAGTDASEAEEVILRCISTTCTGVLKGVSSGEVELVIIGRSGEEERDLGRHRIQVP